MARKARLGDALPATGDDVEETSPLLEHKRDSSKLARGVNYEAVRDNNDDDDAEEETAGSSNRGYKQLTAAHTHTSAGQPHMGSGETKKPRWKFPSLKLDKKTRIGIFIAIDLIFFFIEIITGYWTHSLSLVADAFHMLNDVISLCVGLWAVSVAETRQSSHEYTYGWVRGEILGGFVNGVFLIALCLSIVLDAIQRFFEPQEVSNPEVVLIVGAVGLLFNIVGLFVFHQHSHGHGGHDHEHEHVDELDTAEHGHSSAVERHAHNHDISHKADESPEAGKSRRSRSVQIQTQSANDRTSVDRVDGSSQSFARHGSSHSRRSRAGSSHHASHSLGGVSDGPLHPEFIRKGIISIAREGGAESSEDESASFDEDVDEDQKGEPAPGRVFSISHRHYKHGVAQKKSKQAHLHSHEDMNIRGIFLHVLGDALGNIGVMASALIIWQTKWSFRFYFDPIISLFITLIILKSAYPLVIEAGRSLLQAAPRDISVQEIQDDIEDLEMEGLQGSGPVKAVRSCHHVHVWALTPKKRVATLDVVLDYRIGKDPVKYMEVIKRIQQCLREEHQIHSSTIMPEFSTSLSTERDLIKGTSKLHPNMDVEPTGLGVSACLLEGKALCQTGKSCCTPLNGSSNTSHKGSPDAHDHGHDELSGHGHDHSSHKNGKDNGKPHPPKK